MSNTPTPDQCKAIEQTVHLMVVTLRANDVPLDVSASALMVAAARIAIYSQETDEFIVDQFRRTIAAARQRMTGQQETRQ